MDEPAERCPQDSGPLESRPPDSGPPADREAEPGRSNALPPWLESWRRRSATGAVLSGIALGLRQALEPEREEPAIVAPTPGGPPGPQPLELHLDRDRPEEAWAVVRPWLVGQEHGPEEDIGVTGRDESAADEEEHRAH